MLAVPGKIKFLGYVWCSVEIDGAYYMDMCTKMNQDLT